MALVTEEDVRELLDSAVTDATMVVVEGKIMVLPEDEADGLILITRRDLMRQLDTGGLTAEDVDDHKLGQLAAGLDTIVGEQDS